jgi:hypothetical protein
MHHYREELLLLLYCVCVCGAASVDQVQSAFNVAFLRDLQVHHTVFGLQGGTLAEYFHLTAVELA